MYFKQTRIQNEIGLHARPACDFVRLATTYSSAVNIGRVGQKKANAKSVLLLLTQGLSQGTMVEIEANGSDEEDAVNALVNYLEELS